VNLRSLSARVVVAGALMVCATLQSTTAQQVLYAGAGIGSTDNVGALMTINQTNGSGTLVGTPATLV